MVMTPHAELNEPVDELTADELDLVAGGWFAGCGSSAGSGSATTGGPSEAVSFTYGKLMY
jgi:hypothetical protein